MSKIKEKIVGKLANKIVNIAADSIAINPERTSPFFFGDEISLEIKEEAEENIEGK